MDATINDVVEKDPGLGCPAAIIGLLNTSLCMRWLIEKMIDSTYAGLGSDVVEFYDTDDICLSLLDM